MLINQIKITQINSKISNKFNVCVSNFTLETPQKVKLIENLNFAQSKGDVLAIIGDEGVGKTCLLKSIVGILPSDFTISGKIIANKPYYVPQFTESCYLSKTPYEFLFLKSPNDTFGDENWNRYTEVASIFDKLNINLDTFFEDDKILANLSHGELKKLEIVKLILNAPSVILLDEPTNHLDLSTILWLETFIKNFDGTTIIVSHDEQFLENVSTNILFLQRGKTLKPIYRYSGNGYKEFLKKFEDEVSHSKDEIEAFKKEQKKQKRELAEFKEKFAEKSKKAKPQNAAEKGRVNRGEKKALQQITQKKQDLLNDKDKPEAVELNESIRILVPNECKVSNGKVMLQFETPLLKIKDRVLSKNIKLHIQGPEKVVIIGDNGKGKSTLLNEILTYLKNLNDSSVNVGYLPQNYQETLENSTLSPVDILKKHSDAITTIKTLLGHMNFKRDDMDKSISLLSGGQKCKTLITSLLLQKPNFLFLDEPTNNLYPLSNRAFRQFLIDFPGAALIISHDRMVINEVATKVYKLTNNGLELVK